MRPFEPMDCMRLYMVSSTSRLPLDRPNSSRLKFISTVCLSGERLVTNASAPLVGQEQGGATLLGGGIDSGILLHAFVIEHSLRLIDTELIAGAADQREELGVILELVVYGLFGSVYARDQWSHPLLQQLIRTAPVYPIPPREQPATFLV